MNDTLLLQSSRSWWFDINRSSAVYVSVTRMTPGNSDLTQKIQNIEMDLCGWFQRVLMMRLVTCGIRSIGMEAG